MVRVDPDQIGRILLNLIRNGYQAVGDSGKLFLTTTTFDHFVSIDVIDTGPGIESENWLGSSNRYSPPNRKDRARTCSVTTLR